MDDWDLLAVVRGRNGINYNMEVMESPICSYINNIIDDHDDDSNNFLFNAYAFDELEELYKPFYPAGPADASSSNSTTLSPLVSLPEQAEEVNAVVPRPRIAKEPVNKYKKRKNQQKRVVKEVREDGLGLDMWAWRKYGQKPIKGSPFPRSYYRCSSSKGCLARKQVERSPIDPSLFIITYTADHTHPHPARRNSLAGTTRTKSPPGPHLGPSDHVGPSDDKARVITDSGVDHGFSREEEEEEGIVVKMECGDLLMQDQSSSELFAELDGSELVASNTNNTIDDDPHNHNHNQSELLFFDDRLFVDLDDNNWFVDQYSNATLTGAC